VLPSGTTLAPETHLVKSMEPSWVTPAALSSKPFVTRSNEIARKAKRKTSKTF